VVSICLFGAVLSWAIARGMIYCSRRLSLIDIPNERSCHSLPTPRGGGIGIAAAFFVTGTLLLFNPLLKVTCSIMVVLVAVLANAVLGFLSDRYNLSEIKRIAAQLLIALAAVIFSGRHDTLEIFGFTLPLAFFGIIFFTLWLVAVTNFYNFMDGIDGLAAMQAIFAGLVVAILSFSSANYYLAVLGLCLCAAAAGFAILNLHPAKIFMGDSGSYMIGFFLACVPLIDGRLFMPIVITLGLFLFDTIVTLLRRIYKKEEWYKAHRSHFYQRAVLLGYSHKAVTSVLSWFFIFLSVMACFYFYGGMAQKLVSFILSLIILSTGAFFVKYKEKQRQKC